MQISVKRSGRCPYPPTGRYMGPPPVNLKFNDIQIIDNFKPYPLRPAGVRQPSTEANILSRIKAKVNGYGSTEGDILHR